MTEAGYVATNAERGIFTNGRSFDPLCEPAPKTGLISEYSKQAIEGALRSRYFIPKQWIFRGNCLLCCVDDFRKAFNDNHSNNGTYIEIIEGSFFVHIDRSEEPEGKNPHIKLKESDGLGAVFEVPTQKVPIQEPTINDQLPLKIN